MGFNSGFKGLNASQSSVIESYGLGSYGTELRFAIHCCNKSLYFMSDGNYFTIRETLFIIFEADSALWSQ